MTLKSIINEAKTWSKKDQIEFCRFISRTVTIAIRSVLHGYDDQSYDEKLDAIKWINEFHHRIMNLRFNIERVVDNSDKIDLLKKHAIHYANQNPITKGEIAEILRLSYNATKRNISPSRKTKVEASIFELIEKEGFRKRTAMYISEDRISTLKAFMDGYFYALDAMEIHLQETGPKFEGFNDWVAAYFGWSESTAGWKNIILQESNGDESAAVDLFFKVYDKFKTDTK